MLCTCSVTLAASVASSPAARAAKSDKVTLCHKVGGPQFVQITLSQSGALNGHAKKHPDDIIPPFPGFSGQNWDPAGRATWNNGCVAPPSEQHIRVFATCIDAGPGGTYAARFGYESENVVERTIAVGTDNEVQPGGPGRGQPTVFQPGHVAEAFVVPGVPSGTTLAWRVRFAGGTSTATASSATPLCNPAPPKPTTGVFVACVQPRAGGTYDATFGYQNDEATAITVPIGSANAVTPGGPDRGQPSVFSPGRVDEAFTVTGVPRGTSSTWTVRGAGVERSATATVGSPLCTTPPPPTRPVGIFVKCVAPHVDGTYDATFGYDNPNPATVEIPIGLANRFSPDPQARGQTTLFAPGNTQEAFTVSGIPRATTLVWTLAYQGTRTASASWDSPTKCPDVTPPPVPGSVGVFLACVTMNGHTYSATFGYENPGPRTLPIAIGSRNGFEPAPVDRGQPSEFEPGNVQKAFTLAGIARSSRPTWTVVAPDGGSSSATADPTARDCVTDPPPPAPQPELRVHKIADTSVAVVGQPIRYRLTVRNTGTGSALALRLTDRLPHGLNLRGIEAGRLPCIRGASVSCRTPQLLPGRSITFYVTAVPTRAGTLINAGEADAGGVAGRVSSRAVVRVRPISQPVRRPAFTG